MTPSPEFATQADFARMMNVSRAAVSQWKSNGILTDAAFSEPNKKGKLVVSVATEDVRRNRDIGQSLGNGMATGAGASAEPVAPAPDLVPDAVAPDRVAPQPDQIGDAVHQKPVAQDIPRTPTPQDLLIEARLEKQLRENRLQAADEAVRAGLLMSSDDAREQMARIAGMMLQIFEGSLTDFSDVIARKFDVSQRDVLHLLKSEFRNVRSRAADKERARLADTEKDVSVSLKVDA